MQKQPRNPEVLQEPRQRGQHTHYVDGTVLVSAPDEPKRVEDHQVPRFLDQRFPKRVELTAQIEALRIHNRQGFGINSVFPDPLVKLLLSVLRVDDQSAAGPAPKPAYVGSASEGRRQGQRKVTLTFS